MKKKMKVIFSTHEEDSLGLKAIEILKEISCETLTLQRKEVAQPGYVVFFTTTAKINGKYLRVAAHRLLSEEFRPPDWAETTPFLVAIRSDSSRLLPISESFRRAILNVAKMYEDWFDRGTIGCPWGSLPIAENHTKKLEEWLSRVKKFILSIDSNLRWQMTAELHPTKIKAKKKTEMHWFF